MPRHLMRPPEQIMLQNEMCYLFDFSLLIIPIDLNIPVELLMYQPASNFLKFIDNIYSFVVSTFWSLP